MAAARDTLKHELIILIELASGLKTRIKMIATTDREQVNKDRDLSVFATRIDESLSRATRAFEAQ